MYYRHLLVVIVGTVRLDLSLGAVSGVPNGVPPNDETGVLNADIETAELPLRKISSTAELPLRENSLSIREYKLAQSGSNTNMGDP